MSTHQTSAFFELLTCIFKQNNEIRLIKNFFGPYLLQQDNAPAHTADATQNFLRKYSDDHSKMEFWPKLVWPTKSHDLSGIDNTWPELQRFVCHVGNKGSIRTSVVEIRIKNFFENYPKQKCRTILESMFSSRITKLEEKKFDIIS